MKNSLLVVFCGFLWVCLVCGQNPTCGSSGCIAYNSKNSCQCDSGCTNRKDCCSDYTTVCMRCGSVGCQTNNPNRGCQCNAECSSKGNCCSDYQATCVKGKNVLACTKAPTTPGDRRADKSVLRVMEYNLEWLFTNYSHSMGDMICPGECEWTNNSVARDHLETLAAYILTFDPDIIVVVEVSDCWVLSELINQMGAAGQVYKPYLQIGIDTSTGQNVGLITKIDPIEDLTRSSEMYGYPVSGSNCGYKTTSKPTTSCSKHYKTRFQITTSNGESFYLALVGLHFIAYPTTSDRCSKREAQAWIVRNYLSQAVTRGDQIIVAGDYNDFDDKNLGADGEVPTSQVVKILREMTTPNLQNVNSWVPQAQRYSSWYDINGNCKDDGVKEHSLIDHMLVSSILFSTLSSVEAAHGYPGVCNSLYSDHYPIIAEFNLGSISL